MPILQNAKKALKVSKRKAAVNAPIRSRLRTAVEAAKKAADAVTMSQAFSAIDKAVKGHIIHRKKAARIKSQLAKKTAAPAEKPAKAAPKAAKAKSVKKAAK
jgi:ribosomal protein S20